MTERVAQVGAHVEVRGTRLVVTQAGAHVEIGLTGLQYLPPTNLACSVVSSVQIHLSWDDNSSDEVGFKIERAHDPAGPWDQIDTVGANIEEYDDIGLDPNTEYCYRVRAYK